MKLWKLNPFVRTALRFLYQPKGFPVSISDFHIIYIDSGELHIRFEKQDKLLPCGSVIYLPAGSVYELYMENDTQEEFPTVAAVNFDLTPKSNRSLKIQYPVACNSAVPVNMPVEQAELADIAEADSFLREVCIFENAQPMRHLIMKLVDEFQREQQFFREVCSCTLKELIVALHRDGTCRHMDVTAPVEDLKRYLESNYASRIDNVSLAGRYGYHTNSLERLFKEKTGTSIRSISCRFA